MAVDGPQSLVQAEKAVPLVQPANQQASSVVKQWHEDLGAAAAAVQPSPQHHLRKVDQRVDVQFPIDKSREAEADDKPTNQPDHANQIEADARIRDYILNRGKRGKSRQRGGDDEEDETEGEGARENARHSRDDDGSASSA